MAVGFYVKKETGGFFSLSEFSDLISDHAPLVIHVLPADNHVFSLDW